jgi:hypothetical protein
VTTNWAATQLLRNQQRALAEIDHRTVTVTDSPARNDNVLTDASTRTSSAGAKASLQASRRHGKDWQVSHEAPDVSGRYVAFFPLNLALFAF